MSMKGSEADMKVLEVLQEDMMLGVHQTDLTGITVDGNEKIHHTGIVALVAAGDINLHHRLCCLEHLQMYDWFLHGWGATVLTLLVLLLLGTVLLLLLSQYVLQDLQLNLQTHDMVQGPKFPCRWKTQQFEHSHLKRQSRSTCNTITFVQQWDLRLICL